MRWFGKEDSPQDMSKLPQQSINSSPARQICAAINDTARAIPAIEFRHVKFSYGDRFVLDDLSFEVMRNEPLRGVSNRFSLSFDAVSVAVAVS